MAAKSGGGSGKAVVRERPARSQHAEVRLGYEGRASLGRQRATEGQLRLVRDRHWRTRAVLAQHPKQWRLNCTVTALRSQKPEARVHANVVVAGERGRGEGGKSHQVQRCLGGGRERGRGRLQEASTPAGVLRCSNRAQSHLPLEAAGICIVVSNAL